MIDAFISEMAVSDLHGGGLTLQRVAGDDLSHIRHYVHVSHFARQNPPIPKLADRSTYLIPTLEHPRAYRWLGWSIARRMQRLRAISNAEAARAARSIEHLLEPSRPISLIVCPQGQQSVRTVEYLKRRRPVDYITWIMDDHVVRWGRGRWQYPNGFGRQFQRHLAGARAVFVISPVMQEFYRHEFGVDSEVLFGSADPVGRPVFDSPTRDGVFRIGYFGRIWPWQLGGLETMARAIDPSTERLHVFCPEASLPEALRCPGVILESALPKERVIETMRQHDAVLIPVSFDESLRHLTELNIATKMSECLASGTLLIACGPPYAAMIRYLQERSAACCITDSDGASWRERARALRDPAVRRKILDAAAVVVEREVCTRSMRERWRRAVERLDATA